MSKPSERIAVLRKKILKPYAKKGYSMTEPDVTVKAIVMYLDEVAERKEA